MNTLARARELGKRFFGSKFRETKLREYKQLGCVLRIGEIKQIVYRAQGSDVDSIHKFKKPFPLVEVSAGGKQFVLLTGVRFTGRGFL